MKNYINERIKDKIKIQIQSNVNRINGLFKTRHNSLDLNDKEMLIKLISFTIRNLKVWKEIKKRNEYYETRIQK